MISEKLQHLLLNSKNSSEKVDVLFKDSTETVYFDKLPDGSWRVLFKGVSFARITFPPTGCDVERNIVAPYHIFDTYVNLIR